MNLYLSLLISLFFRNNYIEIPKYELTPTLGIKLPINYVKQKYSYSCEFASAKALLSYYDINVTEDEIINKTKINDRPIQDGIWGDPEIEFVGRLDGNGPKESYGIHWKPISQILNNWGEFGFVENAKISDLKDNIDSFSPVLVWIVNQGNNKMSWFTKERKKVEIYETEHVIVVVGYEEYKNQIVGFYVMDPFSKVDFINLEVFIKKWHLYNNVYVYKK